MVRLGERDGMIRVQFGNVEAQVDAIRDAVLINGKHVSVRRLVEMGSHGRRL